MGLRWIYGEKMEKYEKRCGLLWVQRVDLQFGLNKRMGQSKGRGVGKVG